MQVITSCYSIVSNINLVLFYFSENFNLDNMLFTESQKLNLFHSLWYNVIVGGTIWCYIV